MYALPDYGTHCISSEDKLTNSIIERIIEETIAKPTQVVYIRKRLSLDYYSENLYTN